VAFVLCSAVSQAWTPILGTDERMYHASRVIYWIQHHSLLPYETHNDRQTVFTFGSELFFLWPVLLTNTEAIARMVFWLGYPLAAIGAYILLRTLRLTPTGAMAGALVLVSTPIVAESSLGLKPELWSMVFILGTGYWAAQICLRPDDCVRSCACLAWFA